MTHVSSNLRVSHVLKKYICQGFCSEKICTLVWLWIMQVNGRLLHTYAVFTEHTVDTVLPFSQQLSVGFFLKQTGTKICKKAVSWPSSILWVVVNDASEKLLAGMSCNIAEGSHRMYNKPTPQAWSLKPEGGKHGFSWPVLSVPGKPGRLRCILICKISPSLKPEAYLSRTHYSGPPRFPRNRTQLINRSRKPSRQTDRQVK